MNSYANVISLTRSIQKCNINGNRRISDLSRADSALHQIFFYNKGAARATLPNDRRRGWSHIVSTLKIKLGLSSTQY